MKTLFALIFFPLLSFSQEKMNITLNRQVYNSSCTLGTLYVDNKEICKTLELPYRDNQNDISSIPAGVYKGNLRYDKDDKWRIQLVDVPNRTGVQIHIGNVPKSTIGCILVGKSYEKNDCNVLNSVVAYWDLKKSFYGTDYPNATPNKEIILTINDIR